MNIGLLNKFSRFINNVFVPSRNISLYPPLSFNVTNILCAEPPKKKKRIDPAIVRAREERRRKKLEKSIRRLQKSARQLKPIEEIDIPFQLKKELEIRKREVVPMTNEEFEERVKLFKQWNRYKTKQHFATTKLVESLINSQEKALDELKAVSEELYIEAIQIDPELLPYSSKGPTHTIPIQGFEAPDGEYVDITKKYEGET